MEDSIKRKTALTFINPKNEPIIINIGISPVDEAGARQNLEAEIGSLSFEDIKTKARSYLGKAIEKNCDRKFKSR